MDNSNGFEWLVANIFTDHHDYDINLSNITLIDVYVPSSPTNNSWDFDIFTLIINILGDILYFIMVILYFIINFIIKLCIRFFIYYNILNNLIILCILYLFNCLLSYFLRTFNLISSSTITYFGI